MSDVLGLLVGALTLMTLTLGLIGLGVKFALLPWLKDQLVIPIQETHKQVTVNSFKSEELTLLDLVHLLGTRLARVEVRVEAIEEKVDNAAS